MDHRTDIKRHEVTKDCELRKLAKNQLHGAAIENTYFEFTSQFENVSQDKEIILMVSRCILLKNLSTTSTWHPLNCHAGY